MPWCGPRSPGRLGRDPRSTGTSRSPTAPSRRYASSTACAGWCGPTRSATSNGAVARATLTARARTGDLASRDRDGHLRATGGRNEPGEVGERRHHGDATANASRWPGRESPTKRTPAARAMAASRRASPTNRTSLGATPIAAAQDRAAPPWDDPAASRRPQLRARRARGAGKTPGRAQRVLLQMRAGTSERSRRSMAAPASANGRMPPMRPSLADSKSAAMSSRLGWLAAMASSWVRKSSPAGEVAARGLVARHAAPAQEQLGREPSVPMESPPCRRSRTPRHAPPCNRHPVRQPTRTPTAARSRSPHRGPHDGERGQQRAGMHCCAQGAEGQDQQSQVARGRPEEDTVVPVAEVDGSLGRGVADE